MRGEKLRVDPDSVSSTSTVTPIFGDQKTNTPANEVNDVDMLAGLTSDLRTVRDTFRLHDVPREVFYIGMAGLVPYVATTVSTLYLAWEIKYSSIHGMGYFLSKETAESLLHVLEPLQVGYGAVILSFLGAIHWGLEFAGYGGRKSVRRYAIGLIAPALAWPTILFPLHEALLTQFIGFTGMYFFDTSATTAGLTPPWYGTYRFVLTLVVGACIVLTLIGRGKIGDDFVHVQSPTAYLSQLRAEQRRNVEKEREERLVKLELDARQNKRNDGEDEEKEEVQKASGNNEDTENGSKKERGDGQDIREQEEGGVKPGDKNEPVREQLRSKPEAKQPPPKDLEPSGEKKSSVKPTPEKKNGQRSPESRER